MPNLDPATIADTIRQTLTRVLRDAGRPAVDLPDEATLSEKLRLDSLDLAVVVVALESDLGLDPFRQGVSPVRTVGELIRVYQTAACQS